MTFPGFRREHDGSLTVRSAVFQALGAASMCWSEPPHGIFDTDRASEIGEALLAFIQNRVTALSETLKSEDASS